eukprot:6778789-Pyramimonas_sp.AAC.1
MYGLSAGCAFADVAVRAFASSECDQFLCRNLGLDFVSYINETGVHVSVGGRNIVLGVAARAGVQFQAASKRLQATPNDKVAAAASDNFLGQEIAEMIGLSKHKSRVAVSYLGTHFSRGRRRFHLGAANVKRIRLKKSK